MGLLFPIKSPGLCEIVVLEHGDFDFTPACLAGQFSREPGSVLF